MIDREGIEPQLPYTLEDLQKEHPLNTDSDHIRIANMMLPDPPNSGILRALDIGAQAHRLPNSYSISRLMNQRVGNHAGVRDLFQQLQDGAADYLKKEVQSVYQEDPLGKELELLFGLILAQLNSDQIEKPLPYLQQEMLVRPRAAQRLGSQGLDPRTIDRAMGANSGDSPDAGINPADVYVAQRALAREVNRLMASDPPSKRVSSESKELDLQMYMEDLKRIEEKTVKQALLSIEERIGGLYSAGGVADGIDIQDALNQRIENERYYPLKQKLDAEAIRQGKLIVSDSTGFTFIPNSSDEHTDAVILCDKNGMKIDSSVRMVDALTFNVDLDQRFSADAAKAIAQLTEHLAIQYRIQNFRWLIDRYTMEMDSKDEVRLDIEDFLKDPNQNISKAASTEVFPSIFTESHLAALYWADREPNHFARVEALALAAGKPDLVDLLYKTDPSLAGMRGDVIHFSRDDSFYNLPEEVKERLSKETNFLLAGKSDQLQKMDALDFDPNPQSASFKRTDRYHVVEKLAIANENTLSLSSVKTVKIEDDSMVLPLPLGAQLVDLSLIGEDAFGGRAWSQPVQKDNYQVEVSDKGYTRVRILYDPVQEARFQVRFNLPDEDKEKLIPEDLANLNQAIILGIAEDFRDMYGLDGLANSLEEGIKAHSGGAFSVLDLEQAITQAANYSYKTNHSDSLPLEPTPEQVFLEMIDFINRGSGKLDIQCTGAAYLLSAIMSSYLDKSELSDKYQVKRASIYPVIPPDTDKIDPGGSGVIPISGLGHMRVHIYEQNKRVLVMDATPGGVQSTLAANLDVPKFELSAEDWEKMKKQALAQIDLTEKAYFADSGMTSFFAKTSDMGMKFYQDFPFIQLPRIVPEVTACLSGSGDRSITKDKLRQIKREFSDLVRMLSSNDRLTSGIIQLPNDARELMQNPSSRARMYQLLFQLESALDLAV